MDSDRRWLSEPTTLSVGDRLKVFHRLHDERNGWFVPLTPQIGATRPRVGRTDGWLDAVCIEEWNSEQYQESDESSWPVIKWTCGQWGDRRGRRLDSSIDENVTQRMPKSRVRLVKGGAAAEEEKPRLSLVHFRWADKVPPCSDGPGGWGALGAPPSDEFIGAWETFVYDSLGPCYEIITVFVQGGQDLAALNVSLLPLGLSSQNLAAAYFLWPSCFREDPSLEGYVEHERLFATMMEAEAAGLRTCFPHPGQLYRSLTSKSWLPYAAANPALQVPATTVVSRQEVVRSPEKAAAAALKALKILRSSSSPISASTSSPRLEESRSAGEALEDDGQPDVPLGVAKVGYSWEGRSVWHFESAEVLALALRELAALPGSLHDSIYVQDFFDGHVEFRMFLVNVDVDRRETWQPAHIAYTTWKSREMNGFHFFAKKTRSACLQDCFAGDEAALADAEARAQQLLHTLIPWILTMTAVFPPVLRVDVLARPGRVRERAGEAPFPLSEVALLELTEFGGCLCGWTEGKDVLFSALLNCALGS